MEWALKDRYEDACHPARVEAGERTLNVESGDTVSLKLSALDCDIRWYPYREAGSFSGDATVDADGKVSITGGKSGETLHIIAEATTRGNAAVTRYARFILTLKDCTDVFDLKYP